MAAVAVVALALTAAAAPVRYALPVEPEVRLPPGQGADLVAAQCSACHSLDYLVTQPRGKGDAFWRASVAKMVEKYGATIAAGDRTVIEAYLTRTFG